MIVVRTAATQDIPQLVELFLEQLEHQRNFGDERVLASEDALIRSIESRIAASDVNIVVAEKDNRVLGYAEVRIIQRGKINAGSPIRALVRRLIRPIRETPVLVSPEAHKVGYIEEIYVREEMRNRTVGVGYKLYKGVLEWLEQQGAREVEGEIWAENEVALNIVRRLGFVPVRVLMKKTL